jgi:hypothetical protein
MTSTRLLDLAHAVLQKSGTVTWDTHGTVPGQVSHGTKPHGTAETELDQVVNPTDPLSQPLGRGTLGHPQKSGTVTWDTRGTPAKYVPVFGALLDDCPAHIKPTDWQQAVEDSRKFLASWGQQAEAFGWTERELFGLHPVPEQPAANYSRLSRLDMTGLIWLLRGRSVIALTAAEAVMRCRSGATLTYRRQNEPALGPLGDCIDEMLGPNP